MLLLYQLNILILLGYLLSIQYIYYTVDNNCHNVNLSIDMSTPKKLKLFNKALRILHREVHKLDLKSLKHGGLNSHEIQDLTRMIKVLETDIKADQDLKTKRPNDKLVREAEEILKSLNNDKS